ncbi:hypothetical protein G7Y79_00005g017510 [Physcia stellaris]|nr:hypothetical protein G7Y79_00005g017510 [Physcia stellaris]
MVQRDLGERVHIFSGLVWGSNSWERGDGDMMQVLLCLETSEEIMQHAQAELDYHPSIQKNEPSKNHIPIWPAFKNGPSDHVQYDHDHEEAAVGPLAVHMQQRYARMKFCVVNSSYEGTGNIFEEYDPMQNPGSFIDSTHHQFDIALIRKSAEKADIDAMCKGNYDMYLNLMWGQLTDNVAGVEATQYLESKTDRILCNPSEFIGKTKADFYEAARVMEGLLVPGDTPGHFPKIVKYTDGLGSMGLDSLCYTEEAVKGMTDTMSTKEPHRKTIVQDYIRGTESFAVVVEMGDQVVALEPMDILFAPDTDPDQAWLSYSNKWAPFGEGATHMEFVKEEPRRSRLQEAAIKAFESLRMQGRAGWCRVDMRVEEGSGDIYCLEVNHMATIFYPPEETRSDDVVIRETYPGGHEAFFDMLVHTKQFQLSQKKAKNVGAHQGLMDGNTLPRIDKADCNGIDHPKDHKGGASSNPVNVAVQVTDNVPPRAESSNVDPHQFFKPKGSSIAAVYDSVAPTYDESFAKQPFYKWQSEYCSMFDYSGSVLDLGCGTGGIGTKIHEAGWTAEISGVDLSSLSLKTAQVMRHYTGSVSVGRIQDEIMGAGKYDHITSFGALHFLPRVEFNAVIARMFMLARKSVAFDVTDIQPPYNESIIARFGEEIRNHNNVVAYKRFGTPKGWKRALEDEILLFYSPSAAMDVHGIVARFERE